MQSLPLRFLILFHKKPGNPNEHHRQDPVLPASKERNRFRSVVWDEYDSLHQKYLEIGKQKQNFFFRI